jgi:dipeptidyl aminopeptidase/acylaminoacyl peptidase
MLAYREERPALAGMLSTLTGRTIMFETPDHPIFSAYREASTIHHVTKDDAPMLIYHGDADELVDVRQAQALDRALKRAGVPHELIILPGADHGQLKQPMQPTPVDHAATWLLQQLKKTLSR